MSLIEDLAAAAARLPKAAVPYLVKIAEGAVASDDPTEYLARRAAADASREASTAAVEQILGK